MVEGKIVHVHVSLPSRQEWSRVIDNVLDVVVQYQSDGTVCMHGLQSLQFVFSREKKRVHTRVHRGVNKQESKRSQALGKAIHKFP